MTTKEEMTKAVENLKGELRERVSRLETELETNIATMRNQADALTEYQQMYHNGHIALSELISLHEELVKSIPSLMLGYPYSKAKQVYNELDADITSIQNFMNTWC